MGTILEVRGRAVGVYIPHYFVNIIINLHNIFQCLPTSFSDENGFVCEVRIL